jgi:saccharopine dehydrogenase-like NADP-dependent oxidoreductase
VDRQGVLIAGGYGVVGRRLAADLAPDYPGRVIVAGRSQERAQAAAAGIGYGVRGRSLDIADPASIANAFIDVGAVVSCIDQPDRKLLWAALRRGLPTSRHI